MPQGFRLTCLLKILSKIIFLCARYYMESTMALNVCAHGSHSYINRFSRQQGAGLTCREHGMQVSLLPLQPALILARVCLEHQAQSAQVEVSAFLSTACRGRWGARRPSPAQVKRAAEARPTCGSSMPSHSPPVDVRKCRCLASYPDV